MAFVVPCNVWCILGGFAFRIGLIGVVLV